MTNRSPADLSSALLGLRRRAWIVVVITLVVAGAAYALTSQQPKKYDSSSTLLFTASSAQQQLLGTGGAPAQDPDRLAETNRRLVALDTVRGRAARLIGRTDGDLPAVIAVANDGQSNLVNVTATAESPDDAQRSANAITRAFVQLREEAARQDVSGAVRQTQRELDATPRTSTTRRRQLNDNLNRLRLLREVQTGDVRVAQRAELPSSPSSPKVGRSIVFGVFAGLIIGLIGALIADQLDSRVRRPDELEDLTGLPVLASIPQSKALRQRQRRFGKEPEPAQQPYVDRLIGEEREAFRSLLARLRLTDFGRPIVTIAVTSPSAASGKSTVAAALAGVAAESGASTLLVDADVRRPALAGRFHAEDAQSGGFGSALSEPTRDLVALSQRVEVQDNGLEVASFSVLYGGGSIAISPTRLINDGPWQTFLDRARAEYDLVIVDLPPFGAAEVVAPLKLVDGALVVVGVGEESRERSSLLGQELERVGVAPLGMVVNFANAGAAPYSTYEMDRAAL